MHNPGPRPSHVFKLGQLAVLPRLRRSAHRLLPLSMSGKRCRGSVGRCTGTQGEWAQEHARLARARDEWESRVNTAKKGQEGSMLRQRGHHSHHAQSPRHYYPLASHPTGPTTCDLPRHAQLGKSNHITHPDLPHPGATKSLPFRHFKWSAVKKIDT
jgi:hypothetical protein